MAVPVVVVKVLATAATDKRARNVILVLIAAILMPIIILILLICSLVSGTESANQSLLDCSFKGTAISEDFTDEQREMIEDMRDWLAELDSTMAADENSLDENMVKAVFYCLNFGGSLDEDFDYALFCECFDGLTILQLETALQNVSEQFPQYEITENTVYCVQTVYKYLKGD
ncbi:MAG: hypothetical protein NC452_19055 [Eubacterium sp.]|nr:hypothetical protein [Eubacterium sp.]